MARAPLPSIPNCFVARDASSSLPKCLQVQRLQRFATYGYLKQVVLKMIAADLADGTGADLLGDDQSEAISMVTALRYSLYVLFIITLLS